MSAERHVSLALGVDDYDRAITFYCDRTGLFTVAADATIGESLRNVVLRYADPAVPFALVIHRADTPKQAALVGRQGADRALVVLPVADCIKVYGRLREAGAPFVGDPIEPPYGVQAAVIDPFENRVCLSKQF